MTDTPASALSDLRVLDLTDLTGAMCAKLMGDMGADVMKIEPPGGDPTRKIGPFLDARPGRERSLLYWFYNTSKRGLTLDLHTPDGQALFKRLVAKVDVVVESFPPGSLDALGLGYDTLAGLNPRLVLTSITPFGSSGPYADYASSDTVAQALGGMVYVNGFPDDPSAAGTRPASLPQRRVFCRYRNHVGAVGARRDRPGPVGRYQPARGRSRRG